LVLTPLAASEYTLTLAARFRGRPPMAEIRDVVRRIDDRIVIGIPATHTTYERFVGQPRFLATAVGGLAILAGMLIASGVFAVASHAVLRRRRELAVRMTLGATPASIRALILSHALLPAVLGISGGLLAAWWLMQGLGSVLVGVTPRDVSSYVAAAALALAAITAGVAAPMLRASRVDPAVTLRSE
jgi:ABC-type antimicrobial peptide transport system permease subunit